MASVPTEVTMERIAGGIPEGTQTGSAYLVYEQNLYGVIE